MSDFLRSYRQSANVQHQPLDALRRNWLDEAAFAPDAYRDSWGLSPLSPETRGVVLDRYAGERPAIPGDRDWFNQGRPAQLPGADWDGMPGQVTPQTFMQANDFAVLGSQVGDLLQGRPVPPGPQDALTQLGGASPLARLGSGYGGGR